MKLPAIIIWVSPLSFLGPPEAVKISISFFVKIQANSIAPDGTSRSVLSHRVSYHLPMSHKEDVMLMWVFLETDRSDSLITLVGIV